MFNLLKYKTQSVCYQDKLKVEKTPTIS